MQEYIYEQQTVGQYVVKVLQDTCPMSPREWDNMGRMICVHSCYRLGDEQPRDFQEWLESELGLDDEQLERIANTESDYVEALLDRFKRNNIVLPLYLYDHSGITMNTTGFSCRWDSGQVGIIYVSLADVRKEYGIKRVTKAIREKAESVLRGEVETYDQYLCGDVYGYVVEDKDGGHVDSCWGFYGDSDYCLSEGADVAEYYARKDKAVRLSKIKGLIRNRVPLLVRAEVMQGMDA